MKRTIRLASLACVGAAALVALSPAAHAQTTGTTGGPMTFTNDVGLTGSFTTGFSASNLERPTFERVLTFTTATAGTVAISLTSISTGAENDTDFSNVFLSGTGITGNVLIPSIGTDVSESFSLENFALAAGTFMLTIGGTPGTQNGSFGGSVAFQSTSAVPEPGTWAMMLLGFGAVGFSMRRKRPSLLQAA